MIDDVWYTLSEIARFSLFTQHVEDGVEILGIVDVWLPNPSKLYATLSIELLANEKTELAVRLLNRAHELNENSMLVQFVYDLLFSRDLNLLKSLLEQYLADSKLEDDEYALIELVHTSI
jgi:hypothetical protein